MYAQFGDALVAADMVVVTDVYPAREKPIEGVSGETVVRRLEDLGHADVAYVESVARVPEFLVERVRPNDVVVLMGAGDIWRYSRVLAERVVSPEQKTNG